MTAMTAVTAVTAAIVVHVKVVRINNAKAKVNKISNVKVIGKKGEAIATIAIVDDVEEMAAMRVHKAMIVTKALMVLMNPSAMTQFKSRVILICVMRAMASCALVGTSPLVKMPISPSS
jgi:hypothetical protein